MIGRIKGVLLEKKFPWLLIDVNGVGYEVSAPMSTLEGIGEVGSEVVVYTHMTVREDAHLLYGFKSKIDRSYFQALIKINGVGPKLALTILSGMDASTFYQTIINQDVSMLVSIPGIGKKTAERLLVEMKDKVEGLNEPASGGGLTGDDLNQNVIQGASNSGSAVSEAVTALTTLGYKPKEAQNAINKVKQQTSDAEDMIRLALKSMVK